MNSKKGFFEKEKFKIFIHEIKKIIMHIYPLPVSIFKRLNKHSECIKNKKECNNECNE